MPVYNLLEYSGNYSVTSRSLWNYYRDEIIEDENNENNEAGNYRKTAIKSFDYNTKVIGSTLADNNELDTEVVIPLKYLRNFWIFLDLLLIKYEIELDLSWSKRWCNF